MAAYTVDVEVYSANACLQMEKVFPFMLSNNDKSNTAI